MVERYDVVIIGARCAGATTAFHLAEAGLDVALVDRTQLPSDTLSSHFFESPALAALHRMGVLDSLLKTGAPLIRHIDYQVDDLVGLDRYGVGIAEPSGGLCVRRPVLDTAVACAAEGAGAQLRLGRRVTSLVETGGRVSGVVALDDSGREVQLDASLVVGADGTGSTIARLVGARRYHVLRNQRFAYWGYFESASTAAPPALLFHRFEDELYIGSPCDHGLYMAAVVPPLERLDAFQEDLDGAFSATVARSGAVNDLLRSTKRVGPLRGTATYPAFFRESAGPGWVLVGDAGHFKDPVAGQGIADAFRQAEDLATGIVAGLGGTVPLDDALERWWTSRDEDELEMHWLAADLGAAGYVPVVLSEAKRGRRAIQSDLSIFWKLFHHAIRPSELLTSDVLAAAAARLAGTPLGRQAAAELTAMAAAGEERTRLATSPHFENDRTRRAPPSIHLSV